MNPFKYYYLPILKEMILHSSSALNCGYICAIVIVPFTYFTKSKNIAYVSRYKGHWSILKISVG